MYFNAKYEKNQLENTLEKCVFSLISYEFIDNVKNNVEEDVSMLCLIVKISRIYMLCAVEIISFKIIKIYKEIMDRN